MVILHRFFCCMFLMCHFKKIAHMADCSPQFLDNEDALTEASTVVGSDETFENTSYKNLQRVHWLTVHCGPHITLSSLQKAGIHADGCHAAACERGGVITYIHLSTRCRQPALAKFLQHMPGCTSARVVDTLNDKTLVCTPEFLDLVRLLGHGCVTSDGTALGLLSRYLKPPTGKPKRADEELRIAAMERDRAEENTKLRQIIAAMELDYIARIAALEERLQQRDGAGESGGV